MEGEEEEEEQERGMFFLLLILLSRGGEGIERWRGERGQAIPNGFLAVFPPAVFSRVNHIFFFSLLNTFPLMILLLVFL